jgi:hypothetical protein
MRQIAKKIFLLCFLLSFALAACDVNSSCVLQAVAGGSQACQEKLEE